MVNLEGMAHFYVLLSHLHRKSEESHKEEPFNSHWTVQDLNPEWKSDIFPPLGELVQFHSKGVAWKITMESIVCIYMNIVNDFNSLLLTKEICRTHETVACGRPLVCLNWTRSSNFVSETIEES